MARSTTPTVPLADLPEFMRDARKGHLVVVALDEQERATRDTLAGDGFTPTVVASIEQAADSYRDAARELREWHMDDRDGGS